MCAYCGVHYPRSRLRKDAMGFLVCEAEGQGKDALTLDRLNAEGARDASFRNRYRIDGGLPTYVADTPPPYDVWLALGGTGGSSSPPNVPPPPSVLPDGLIVSDIDFGPIVSDVDGGYILSDLGG